MPKLRRKWRFFSLADDQLARGLGKGTEVRSRKISFGETEDKPD